MITMVKNYKKHKKHKKCLLLSFCTIVPSKIEKNVKMKKKAFMHYCSFETEDPQNIEGTQICLELVDSAGAGRVSSPSQGLE
jgi:hypothetical protein